MKHLTIVRHAESLTAAAISCASATALSTIRRLSSAPAESIPTAQPDDSQWNSSYSHKQLTTMIHHHLKNRRVDEARCIFDIIPRPDVYIFTVMINGYSQVLNISEALKLFCRMPVRDNVSWNTVIKGCLDCGCLDLAQKLFCTMPERSVVSWTTIIYGLAQSGRVDIAGELFWKMPDRDTAAWNSMMFGYVTNGRVEDAYKLFKEMPHPNVVSWTTIIGGFDQNGDSNKALSLFHEMRISGVHPTSSTFACLLTACANVPDLSKGVQLHSHLLKSGDVVDSFIGTSLVTLYSNCGQTDTAHKFFLESIHKDVVLCTALITGYGSNGKHQHALNMFCNMLVNGIEPNQSTFSSTLNSCYGLEALDCGKGIHTLAIKLGLDLDLFIANSLIFLYTKLGNIDDSIDIFNNMSKRNLVSWNSIIIGCAQHGCGLWALQFYEQMAHCGVQLDEITYVGLLTACSHSRMLDQGIIFFQMLVKDQSLKTKLEHYVCMVDILGRCGKIEEAEEFIVNMPIEATPLVWLTLLSACRVHSHLEVARRTAMKVIDLEPHNAAAYILLSNSYASCGRWDNVSNVRMLMKCRGVVKIPGCSWITLKGSQHRFSCGDRSHPMSKEIYKKLEYLGGKINELGYVSDKSFVLHDVEDEQKEAILSYHSERLAIAYGLISTVDGSTITVMKNLRVCGDCHSVIKLISKIVVREVVVRDSSRFHHFRNGSCTCGDYW